MTTNDLQDKELTAADVIRKAFQEQHLGPEASADEVKNWVEWQFPHIRLERDYAAQIEAERKKQAGRST
ncbi:MAG: hypothetical protein KY476_07215 [Planctomycetes bacterium]|nr:hypothetical protein [Planctomycetota bacterium]